MPVATAGARPWAASCMSQLKYLYADGAAHGHADGVIQQTWLTSGSATSLWMMPWQPEQ